MLVLCYTKTKMKTMGEKSLKTTCRKKQQPLNDYTIVVFIIVIRINCAALLYTEIIVLLKCCIKILKTLSLTLSSLYILIYISFTNHDLLLL